MEFKEAIRWLPDDHEKTTEAVVVVSSCGTVVKRLPYKRWNKKNNGYSQMKEHIYRQSFNRGKQRYDSEEKIKKHGRYMHVEINGKVFSVHRLVALAFLPKESGKDCVNHKDGVRDHNHFTNLEWSSNEENMSHAWDTGLRNISQTRKLHYDKMAEVLKMRESGMSFAKIGKAFGMAGESIRHRVNQYENGLRR